MTKQGQTMRRWRNSVGMPALAALLLLSACASSEQKAAEAEARADQALAVNDYPAASESLYRAVKYDSNDVGRWVKLARAERMLSNNAQAAIAYQRALDLQPDNVEALQSLAILNLRGGQYDVAKRMTDTLLTLAPDDVGGWLAKGAIALFEGRLKDADAAADRLIQLSPSLSDGPILKARILDAQGKPYAAAAILRQRMELDADNPDVAIQAMTLYKKLGDRTGIQEVSLALARLRPDDPRYQLEAARAHRARGRPEEADAILDALAARYPNNAQVMEALAWQWRENHPTDVAIAKISGIGQKAGASARASLARMLTALGAPDKALAMTQTPAGDTTQNTVDLRSAHSIALLALGKNQAAMDEANSVLMFDWSDGGALLTRARINLANKKYPDALTDAQLVFSNEKTNSEAALLIAQIYAASGNDALAGRAFGTAQDAFPDDFRIHSERIAWLGRTEQADVAANIALSFARKARTNAAWALADRACRTVNNVLCLDQTRPHVRKG